MWIAPHQKSPLAIQTDAESHAGVSDDLRFFEIRHPSMQKPTARQQR